MKRILSISGAFVVIVSLAILVPGANHAQQATNLKVAAAAIGQGIADRQPVDPGTTFSVTVGRLYCYSKITDIQSTTEIVHVWYYGDTERARVTLSVNPPSWRTHSSKIIQAHEIGKWHVKILDAAGNTLENVDFQINPL